MRLIEILFWIVGASSLAAFAGMHAWGDMERQQGIAAFGVAPANRSASPSTLRSDAALAILRIPGVALEVPVHYGTDAFVLFRGAGLVEGTALPGSNGNVAIAAHRDTHFRALKDLSVGDRIELAMLDRTRFYVVTDLSVVEPTDVHVLADTGEPVLTLVTCYPFYFVGHAPQRFIVRAVAAPPPI